MEGKAKKAYASGMPDRTLENSGYQGALGEIYNKRSQIIIFNVLFRYKSYLHVFSLTIEAVGTHEVEYGRSDKI